MKLGYRVTGIPPGTCKIIWMASLSDARSPMFSSSRASSTSKPKDIPIDGKWGSEIGCSGKLQVNWRGILPRARVGIHSAMELGQVQGLFACFPSVFLWTNLLTRSGVGMTGMSRRGMGKSLVLGQPGH